MTGCGGGRLQTRLALPAATASPSLCLLQTVRICLILFVGFPCFLSADVARCEELQGLCEAELPAESTGQSGRVQGCCRSGAWFQSRVAAASAMNVAVSEQMLRLAWQVCQVGGEHL